MGSATLLFSCGKTSPKVEYDLETLMTERSENRTIVMMENGKRSYSFTAPLIEGYSLAQNPYQEFNRGIKLTTYTSDSLSLQDATIKANYAIYYDKQKLWEAKGDVVIIKKNRKDGDTVVTGNTEVYTQQLFWDARTKKIYSNVDTKVLQPDGWHSGVGFEADEDLKNIHFRKYKSEMEFDFSPVDESQQQEDKKAAKPKSNNPPKPGTAPRRPGDSKVSPRAINPSISTGPSASTQPKKPTPSPAAGRGNNKRPSVAKDASLSSSLDTHGSKMPSSADVRGSQALKPPTRPTQQGAVQKGATQQGATQKGATQKGGTQQGAAQKGAAQQKSATQQGAKSQSQTPAKR